MTSLGDITRGPVIPVLTVADIAHAAPLAAAFVAGGVTVLEVTLRTPVALDVIAAMKAAAPAPPSDADAKPVIGAGTVTHPADLEEALAAGADFIVTPGVTPALLEALQDCPVPVLPGAATVSEALRLLEAGFAAQKFFPAEINGGAAALKAFGGPLPQIRFCPTGGVTPESAPSYLALPNVMCVGGTWLAKPADIAAENWNAITERARAAAALRPAPATAG